MNRILFLILAISALGISTARAQKRSEYWHQRVSLFEKLPIDAEDIVFVGNSITDGGEFSELFSNPKIKNRGINSDDISGVTDRMDCILDGKPAKIFLLIGINDISHNLPVEDMAGKYEKLLSKIRAASPATKIYLQSVMPINNDFARYKNLIGKEKTLRDLNTVLKSLAAKSEATYIDLWPALADPGSGKLKKEFTNDGLHLTGEGYLKWAETINSYINE